MNNLYENGGLKNTYIVIYKCIQKKLLEYESKGMKL